MAPLLQVTDLQTHYVSFGGERVIKAVDGVSFTLEEGETLGLVGEVRLRQDDDLPVDRQSAAGRGPHRRRLDQLHGPGADDDAAARDAAHPRRPDRDDPAGPDGLAEPAVQHLPPGHGAGLLPPCDARAARCASGCASC